MGLETGTYLDDLNELWPLGGDGKAAGDNHIRLMKEVLKNTFPGLAGAFARVQSKSANYTALSTDNTSVISCTAAITLSLTAAATLGNKWMLVVYANGAAVTIDPNGVETVNGATTLTLAAGEWAIIWCTGTTFFAMVTVANRAASETQSGLIEIATQAEVTAGADTTRAVTPATLAGLIGTVLEAYDADVLKANETEALSVGFSATVYDHGSISTGTVTPSEANGVMHEYDNAGAHTLSPPSNNTSLLVDITNVTGAGAITTSGFTLVTGDLFTTTVGHKFRCQITKSTIGSHLHVIAFQ